MRIQIINPNTTWTFTERLRLSALSIVADGTEIVAANPDVGAASIESHSEEALGALGVMEIVARGEADGIDAYIIACFGDTGVHQAREIARGPVVGMTEAAVFTAAMLAWRFSIVTLPPRTRAHSARVLHETGLSHRCTLRAVDVPVLDLEDEIAASYSIIAAEARRAIEQDGAEAIILGCAGLVEIVDPLSAELGVPVIDGVLAGVKMAEGLVATRLRTSKRSTYDFPASGIAMPSLRSQET